MAIYMKAKGIFGNATAQGYDKWIELDSIDLGVQRSITTKVGRTSDRERGVPDFSEVEIIKKVDNASNDLFQSVCTGNAIPTVEIHVCSTGKEIQLYIKYLLENVIVSGHHNYMSGVVVPLESLTLNYTKIQKTYIGRDSSNKQLSPNTTGYDLEKAGQV